MARNELVTGLVHDAEAVLAAAETSPSAEMAADSIGLLALIAGRDVEPTERGHLEDRPQDGQGPGHLDGRRRGSPRPQVHRPVRTDGFKAHLATEPESGIITALKLTAANAPDGPVGVELMAAEPDGLEVLADSAYGSGAVRAGLKRRHHRLVIKPLPSRPVIPGGFVRDDFVVDHDQGVVTCPAGHTAKLSSACVARFAPHCGPCPMRSRCTKARARSFSVSAHDAELVEARAAWSEDELRAVYRQHRPMAERSISWLVAKGKRRLRYRGVERNVAWAHRRVAALNLRRLVVLGLTRTDGNWVLAGPIGVLGDVPRRARHLLARGQIQRDRIFPLNSGSSVRAHPRGPTSTLRRLLPGGEEPCSTAP